ncbi:Uncharacterised protein [uncultured Blautia sp.]|nr:Uncharacterised protein [uncultured Blautia sp.]
MLIPAANGVPKRIVHGQVAGTVINDDGFCPSDFSKQNSVERVRIKTRVDNYFVKALVL